MPEPDLPTRSSSLDRSRSVPAGADVSIALPAAVDYGDPELWRDDPVVDFAVGERVEAGWDWLGEDDLGEDRRAAFSRAADDALTTGEELLARDLNQLLRTDLELD